MKKKRQQKPPRDIVVNFTHCILVEATPKTFGYLQRLAKLNIFGLTPNEVAEHFVLRGIQEAK